ncbi:MAG: hypothetical protein AVDCRST_MAG05-36, partial [uncultured Rubrobacteraceae bacterium]
DGPAARRGRSKTRPHAGPGASRRDRTSPLGARGYRSRM